MVGANIQNLVFAGALLFGNDMVNKVFQEWPFMFDDPGERLRVRVLLNNVRHATDGADVVEGNDVGMREPHRRSRCFPKALLNRGSPPDLPLQPGDQYFPPQDPVHCDCAHHKIAFERGELREISLQEVIVRHVLTLG